MKKLTNILSVLGILFVSTSVFAQIDVKVNPLGLLFGDVALGAEFCLSENVGLEPVVSFTSSKVTISGDEVKFNGIGLRAFGKYYFAPQKGTDRFYVGPYLKYRKTSGSNDSANVDYDRTRVALGIATGWKLVADNGFIFEAGLGAGRALVDDYKDNSDNDVSIDNVVNLDIVARLAIGYRFGK